MYNYGMVKIAIKITYIDKLILIFFLELAKKFI